MAPFQQKKASPVPKVCDWKNSSRKERPKQGIGISFHRRLTIETRKNPTHSDTGLTSTSEGSTLTLLPTTTKTAGTRETRDHILPNLVSKNSLHYLHTPRDFRRFVQHNRLNTVHGKSSKSGSRQLLGSPSLDPVLTRTTLAHPPTAPSTALEKKHWHNHQLF